MARALSKESKKTDNLPKTARTTFNFAKENNHQRLMTQAINQRSKGHSLISPDHSITNQSIKKINQAG